MSARRPCPAAPGPLEGYATRFDDLFTRVAQRRGFREYLAGLLAPLAPGTAGPLEASAAQPPAASARRHRFTDIRDTRNRFATSRSLTPASISSAAASRTCSRRARSCAVSPPPSGS